MMILDNLKCFEIVHGYIPLELDRPSFDTIDHDVLVVHVGMRRHLQVRG